MQPIAAGQNVIKYGFAIGHATAAVQPGGWMHSHNLRTNLCGGQQYRYRPVASGQPTRAEQHGCREVAIWKGGVTL